MRFADRENKGGDLREKDNSRMNLRRTGCKLIIIT